MHLSLMCTAGSDYDEISGLLLAFGPGSTRLDVPVNIINDDVFEVTEDFSASLILVEGPADRVAVNPSRADVFILDDDGKHSLITITSIV